ncbi:hypothetical protein [Acidovorax sp. SUPP2539]|uniref:hypothetical protein n=1 Tax=Acidovorax sp. SUPP2539 TaxID=2920878 RepID=UPI0023DE2A86|nr:hypothetical protein [Acidovorax sp. SUPP2539]GKS88747.1 hypothetical protein AVTE2539_05300 [Acidovorax sp. SUPP2539]
MSIHSITLKITNSSNHSLTLTNYGHNGAGAHWDNRPTDLPQTSSCSCHVYSNDVDILMIWFEYTSDDGSALYFTATVNIPGGFEFDVSGVNSPYWTESNYSYVNADVNHIQAELTLETQP